MGQGILASTDGGESWSPFNDGLTSPFVKVIAVNAAGSVLHAGTVGQGVFDFQQ
jgi:hypothetical protein